MFVGNSFTYYNDSLHNHLARMVRAGNVLDGRPRMRSMTISGARLTEHAPAMAAMLRSEPWDLVVLQGHSREVYDPETRPDFKRTVRNFNQQIRAVNARPALFMTWAYTDAPGMTAVIADHYAQTAAEIDALLVPVGLAFAQVTREYPDIQLRTGDKRHPSLAGTYLAACVFYAALFEESPAGNDYTAGLNSEVAATLQSQAWKVVAQLTTPPASRDTASPWPAVPAAP